MTWANSSTHALPMLTHGLCSLLSHIPWTLLTDVYRSSLRCRPKDPRLLGHPGSFPSGSAGVSSCLGSGWRQGPGLGCRAGQQLCELSRDAHTCADLPGAGASTVAAPSTLQLIGGSPCQAGDASLTFLECRGSPRRSKAGRPRLGPCL